MKRNAIAIFLAAFLLIVFAVQCRIPCLTAALTVRTGEHDFYRFASCLIAHGSALHVIVNSAALIILLYGFGRMISAFLIVHALPAALCAVWLYANSLMPDRAWLCGASPLIYALFGLIAWQERKTSVFSLFGIRCLSLPPLPMLGIILLADAFLAKAFFAHVAWPVHTLAGLGGLMTGMLLSFKSLWNPRYATAAIFIAAALAVLLSSGCAEQPKRHPFLRVEIPHTCREAIRFYFAQYRAGQIDLQDLESLCLMCDDVREMQLLEEIGKLKLTQGETP